VDVQRITDGLWRWTAPHPDWRAGGTDASDWPQEVGCVYAELDDATLLVDPLVPAAGSDDERRFLDALDRDVERRGAPVVLLQTIHWHVRSSGLLRARYAPSEHLPSSVEAIAIGDPHEEIAYYLRPYHALVVGDILLGADAHGGPAGELRVCPASWFAMVDGGEQWYRDCVRDALRPLHSLPAEVVLVGHGSPALEHGARELARAIELVER
jgi:hypothetical protein